MVMNKKEGKDKYLFLLILVSLSPDPMTSKVLFCIINICFPSPIKEDSVLQVVC